MVYLGFTFLEAYRLRGLIIADHRFETGSQDFECYLVRCLN